MIDLHVAEYKIFFFMKALVITTETGDRKGEASCYGKLGTVFKSLGKYDEAKEYL